ncbi:hypothetical protein [Glycomyces salinus]|uniref:hypothetical protein n=1 Tax=Glycomyces salinus TaxID=980294 RepID=UPI0018EA8C05|nr:hypothetical protein [Glycomyces salinus]
MKRRIVGILAALAIAIGLAAVPATSASAEAEVQRDPGVYCSSKLWAATGYGPVKLCTQFAYYGFQQIQRPVMKSGLTGEISPHGDWRHTADDKFDQIEFKNGVFNAHGVYESGFGPGMYGTFHQHLGGGCYQVRWGNYSTVTKEFHPDSGWFKTTTC